MPPAGTCNYGSKQFKALIRLSDAFSHDEQSLLLAFSIRYHHGLPKRFPIYLRCKVLDISVRGFFYISRPPVNLIHSTNPYCIIKIRDLFSMNEMGLNVNKMLIFLLKETFRILKMIFVSIDVYEDGIKSNATG